MFFDIFYHETNLSLRWLPLRADSLRFRIMGNWGCQYSRGQILALPCHAMTDLVSDSQLYVTCLTGSLNYGTRIDQWCATTLSLIYGSSHQKRTLI